MTFVQCHLRGLRFSPTLSGRNTQTVLPKFVPIFCAWKLSNSFPFTRKRFLHKRLSDVITTVLVQLNVN